MRNLDIRDAAPYETKEMHRRRCKEVKDQLRNPSLRNKRTCKNCKNLEFCHNCMLNDYIRISQSGNWMKSLYYNRQ